MNLLMNEVLLASDDALTQALAARIKTLWDARRGVDASRLNALLTDDYMAVHPDGTLHVRKPTEQEIALEEIDHYRLTHLRAAPVGPESALVTYFAEIGIASHIGPTNLKFAVGEVWIKQLYDWKCRYSQATVVK
ncbi:MAG: nuclear transport factor 2 family protein [Candidatus Sulfotelmatobacter sp.]